MNISHCYLLSLVKTPTCRYSGTTHRGTSRDELSSTVRCSVHRRLRVAHRPPTPFCSFFFQIDCQSAPTQAFGDATSRTRRQDHIMDQVLACGARFGVVKKIKSGVLSHMDSDTLQTSRTGDGHVAVTGKAVTNKEAISGHVRCGQAQEVAKEDGTQMKQGPVLA